MKNITLFLILLFVLIPLNLSAQSYFDFTDITENQIKENLFKPLQSVISAIAFSSIKSSLSGHNNLITIQFNKVYFDADNNLSILNSVKTNYKGKKDSSAFMFPLISFGREFYDNDNFALQGYLRGAYVNHSLMSGGGDYFPSDKDGTAIIGGGISGNFLVTEFEVMFLNIAPTVSFHYFNNLPYTDSAINTSLCVTVNSAFNFEDIISEEFYINLGIDFTALKATNLPVLNDSFMDSAVNMLIGIGFKSRTYVNVWSIELVFLPSFVFSTSFGISFPGVEID